MAVIRAKIDGVWTDLFGGADEVFVGPNAPTDPSTELWYDSDAADIPVSASQIAFSPTATIIATDVQAAITEVVADIGPTAWIVPTLLNSWVAYGSGWSNPGYRKIGDIVQLRGLYKGGAAGTAIFMLPVGYTPGGGSMLFPARASDAPGQARVLSGGSVEAQLGTMTGWFCLDGISFSVTA